MNIIKPSVEILTPLDADTIYRHLERCGRVCYRSEHRIADGTAEKFLSGIIKSGHESVLEHYSITVRFVCDRGVTHEIVRHRLAAFSQESTRYANYSKEQFGSEITVIKPLFFEKGTPVYNIWKRACQNAETAYFDLLNEGRTPQEARSVLPNSLKTELMMTANIREWRTVLKLRTSPAAHPQIREVMNMLLNELAQKCPVLFGDIGGEDAER